MRDVELLIFHGYDDLAGRLLPGAEDGMPRGKAVVHHALDPKGQRVLLVEPVGQPTGSPAGVKKVKGRFDTATNRVLTTRSILEKVLYSVEKSESVEMLLHALKPSPGLEPPVLEREGHVLAWCADAAQFSLLVQECLSLGCDRIRFAPVGTQGAAPGAILVRIDSPPWYLIERWSRPENHAVPIYARAANRFYVRWGWDHPLAGRITVKDAELVLAEADGSLRRAPDADWRDVYDALAISADGLASVKWGAADPAPRFTVKLKLVQAPEPVEAELWLLRREDVPAVERLLGLMPEADLKHLAIAFFDRAPHSSPGSASLLENPLPAEPVAAMREVITGRGRGWVNFGSTGFRALPGLSNLYLPIDKALDPQVRRDRIAEAFTLKGGEFVIVQAEDAGGMRGVRVPEASFRPLSTYIDYVVTGDSPRLQALVQSTVFDPGPLAELAEASPDVRERKDPTGPRTPAVNRVADGGKPQPQAGGPAPAVPDEPEPAAPEPEAPHVSSEQQVEARIALEPPGAPVDWIELGELRRVRGDVDGALECWENARWVDRSTDEAVRRRAVRALETALHIPSTAPPGERPALALSKAESPGDVRTLRLRALYLEDGSIPEVTHQPEYFQALYGEARAAQQADRLRKKSRWLVWSAILSRTGDDIEVERQREAILADLNQAGLAPMDRADFVRARLAERSVDGGDSGELRRTMEGLTTRLAKIDDARLKWSGVSLLARRWAELDDVVRARKLANESIAAMADGATAASARIHANAAVALLRTRDPNGDAPFRKALEIIGRLSNAEDRGRTLFAALESLSAVNDVRAVAPLVEAAMAILEKEDVRRCALSLARCAPLLKKLEATSRGRDLALARAQDPKVQQDAHYFAGAVGALSQLQGSKALPPSVLNPILDAVRRLQRELDEVSIRLFEGAVALAGEDFAREISESMKRRSAGEMRFADLVTWAAALEGLAAARASDAGLQDLDRALKVAWGLPNEDERRRGVRRLTSVIPLFGRVRNGNAIVEDVVRRAGAAGVGPYFRGKVLSVCVDVSAKLGDRQGAFGVMNEVIKLVEATARSSAGDVTFLFDVLGLCVDHAVTIGAAGESKAIIDRVDAFVLEWMDESSARYWTPFYRYRARVKCARGYARLGHEATGMPILSQILDQARDMQGLDRIDLLREIVHCLSEVGGAQRLTLVDRVLDAFVTTDRASTLGEQGTDLLGLLLDEVVSPASRVRAEYARYLGSEERNIRERVANDRIVG